MRLYLDDNRVPTEDDWNLVKNFDEFVNFIAMNGVPDEVSFDHDLDPEHYNNAMYQGREAYNKLYATFKHPTGLHCAKFLSDYCMNTGVGLPSKMNVHSQNPAGSLNIVDHLLSASMMMGNEDPTVTRDTISFEYV